MGVNAAMYVHTEQPVTDQDVRQWAYELAATFGIGHFYTDREKDIHCLQILSRDPASADLDADRTCLTPSFDELLRKRGTLISVHITGRYNDWYDFPFLVVIAEWLERRIPDATLWYGPTSGGEVAVEPFGPEERRDIVEGFFARGGGSLATASDAIGVLLDHPDLVPPSATFQH